MAATLQLERIERRLSTDEVSDAEWLRTETDADDDGQPHIVSSWRYGDNDIATYGASQVEAWIAEDHSRYQAFGDSWWFVDAQAVAVIGVHVGEEKLGTVELTSACVGGIESDAPVGYYDELTGELIEELKEQLMAQGLLVPDGVEAPYVGPVPWLVEHPTL